MRTGLAPSVLMDETPEMWRALLAELRAEDEERNK